MPGAHGPKTVKGAQSDPNYVSRLLDCVPVFHKIITPAYFLYRSVDCRFELALEVQRWTWAGPVANVCLGGGKNYSYVTATE